MKNELKKELKSLIDIILKFVSIKNKKKTFYFAKRDLYLIIKLIEINNISESLNIFEIKAAIFYKLIKNKIHNLFIITFNKINNNLSISI